VPLVITGSGANDLTFISSVLTWQSYNQWGGESLYKGADGNRKTAASVVSFDRPYDGDGSGQFRYMEQPLITLMEKNGLDINYITDLEVDSNPEVFAQTRSIVLGGHSEYWTQSMRQHFDNAVASGTNLIVFGGNTGYAVTEIKLRNISGRTPYRKIGNPESLLLGSQYFAVAIRKDLVSNNAWPFSVLGEDAQIKGIYGYEADTAMGTVGPGVQVLARAVISPTEKGFVAMSLGSKDYMIFSVNEIIYPKNISEIKDVEDYYNFAYNTRSESEFNSFYSLFKANAEVTMNDEYMRRD
jgi:hypothetical protein